MQHSEIDEVNVARLEVDPTPLETMDAFYQQPHTMISSPAVRDAFGLYKESDELKLASGFGRFFEKRHYDRSKLATKVRLSWT